MKSNIKYICLCTILTFMIMALCACGGEEKVQITDDMTPSQTVEAFLASFKAKQWDNMDKIYAGSSEVFRKAYDADTDSAGDSGSGDSKDSSKELNPDISEAIREAMSAKFFDFDYKVDGEDISKDGKTATVDITITSYDMVKIFNNFYKEYMDQALEKYAGNSGSMKEDDLQEMALSILQKEMDKTTEKDREEVAVLSLTKGDDRWVIDKINEANNAQFLNAISGGMMNVASDIVNVRTDESSEGDSDRAGGSESDSE